MFASYVNRGQSKPQLIFFRINDPNVSFHQQEIQNKSWYFTQNFYLPSTFPHRYHMIYNNARSDSEWVLSTGQCHHNSLLWMPIAKTHKESLFYFAVSCGECSFTTWIKLAFTAPNLNKFVMDSLSNNAIFARKAIVTKK